MTGDSVSVIATATNSVVGTIPVGSQPYGVAVTPDGSKVYITNTGLEPFNVGTVSVINTATNTVVGTIPVGSKPEGVAVTPDGCKVYVANHFNSFVSVIATATNTVVGSIPVGGLPNAFGLFTQPFTGFSAFTDQLTVYPNRSVFNNVSNFTVGGCSGGINPPSDPVTLRFGNFNKITIPPGSFIPTGQQQFGYVFTGVINDGISVDAVIRHVSGNSYIFEVNARNVRLTIPNPPNTVPVTLTIGDNSGTANVNAVIINTQ